MQKFQMSYSILILSFFLLLNMSLAGKVNWVSDWQIQTADSLATGTTSQNGVQIDVSYTGHISYIAYASYWSEGNPAPYTGNDVVDNAPTSGITLTSIRTGDSVYANVLEFSSPVIDPVFALYSVGSSASGVPYQFDQGFTLLSEGAGGWGDGYFTVDSNTIIGYEGNGVIQFHGEVSRIAWNLPVAESHHGFSIGVLDSAVSNIGTPINKLPSQYHLSQNYPNPFNPSTVIEFSVPASQFVTLKVYNILGKEIATLVSDELKPGSHSYTFYSGNLAGGIYFYRLSAGEFNRTKKMVLVR